MLFDRLPILSRLGCILVGCAVLLSLWQLAIWLAWVEPLLLPPPGKVGTALMQLATGWSFWKAVLSTTWTWLAGVILGAIGGIIGGFLLGINRYVWAAFEPWIEFMRSLPSVVLVPLVSLFLGVGGTPRLVCSAIVVFVLLLSAAGPAIRSTKAAHLRLASAWGVSTFDLASVFVFPAVLSHMMLALRAAIPIALIVAVAADMLVATDSGIGKIIMDSLAVFDTATMYASVCVVGLLGYLAALLGSAVEKFFIHWSSI